MFFSFAKPKDMGIDLGTANTLIYEKDKGIVLAEPSVIAKDLVTNEVIAVGQAAKEMLGKVPKNISVVRPLQDGVISDFDMTADMLKEFILKALQGSGKAYNLRVVVGVPSGVTEVEKRAVEDVVHQLGAKEVYILEEPFAAAIGAGLDVNSSEGCMIVDIGGGTTDIAIIAIGGIVTSSSLRYAGDKFNEAIIAYMRKKYSLLIGEQTAEFLKISVGCALLDIDEEGNEIIEYVDAKGRDLVSGLPKIVQVSNKDMFFALEESVEMVVDAVKTTFEKTAPEIAADIVTNGITLSGGGAYIKHLDTIISQRTGIDVHIAENAFEAVAVGTGKSLENIETLKKYANTREGVKYR